MLFEWTVSLGSVISALSVSVATGIAVFKVLYNQLEAVEHRLSERLTGIETDIRQLRDWVLVARDNK